MNKRHFLLLGAAGLLASASAAMAAAPGGGGFGQYTANAGVITSTSIVGQTATPVTLVTGNGYLQQKVTTSQGSFYRTIVLDSSATATDAAGVAALGFSNETFTGSVSSPGDTGDTTEAAGCGSGHFNPISDAPTPVSNAIGETVDRRYPQAYIPNGSDGTVSVVDTATYQTVATIPVQPSPYGVAIDPRGLRVYVSYRGSNSVSVIDADTFEVVATIWTGAMPAAGLAVDHEGARLYIALESENAISVVDTKTLTEIGRIDLSHPPHDIVLSPVAPVAYVLSRSDAFVSRIDLAAREEVGGTPLAVVDYNRPTALTVSADGTRIYALVTTPDRTASMLEVIDSASGSVEHQDVFNQALIDITQNAAGTSLYLVPYTTETCTQIMELDATSYEVARRYLAPAGIVRGEFDGEGFDLISRDMAAMIATRYPAAGEDMVDTRTAPIGDMPDALGDFIGPLRAPAVTPDAAALDFGRAAAGDSVLKTLTLTNTGSLPLKVYRATVEAPACSPDCGGEPNAAAFTVVDNGCDGNTVAVAAACAVTLSYAAGATAVSLGTLRLDTNGDQDSLDIPLRGAAAPVSVATTSGDSADKELPAAVGDEGGEGGGGGGALGPMDLLIAAFAFLASGLARIRSRYRRAG